MPSQDINLSSYKRYWQRITQMDPAFKMIFITLACSFVNMIFSFIAAIVTAIYLLCSKERLKCIFNKKQLLLYAFFILAIGSALFNGNYIGLVATVFGICVVIIFLYVKSQITMQIYEDFITALLGYSILALFLAAVETLIQTQFFAQQAYRASSSFFNPLYYAYFTVFAALFCMYRLITRKQTRKIYLAILICNMVGMLLTGSRMPWMGLFAGILLILFSCRKYKQFAIAVGIILVLVAIGYFGADLPFLSALRLNKIAEGYHGRAPYWEVAIEGIKDYPLFGQGLLTHLHNTMAKDVNWQQDAGKMLHDLFQYGDLSIVMRASGWQLHAHNMLFDSLLNFGFVGTGVLCLYIAQIFIRFFYECDRKLYHPVFAMLLSLSAAILVNGIVDVEIIGLQTIVFTLILFGVLGVKQNEMKKRLPYIYETPEMEPKL